MCPRASKQTERSSNIEISIALYLESPKRKYDTYNKQNETKY